MKIERKQIGKRPYFTVLVDKDELVVDSGKALPYSAWIGTIQLDGKITIWQPAGSCPLASSSLPVIAICTRGRRTTDTWDWPIDESSPKS